ncbi:ATP-binding cassette domain-containing protein [Celeribacter indicus]|uniref:ABC transporter n=1 Tax=Celeribacter indicus TaxID=1208324 RepID=A0A0B5DWC3_9RHOB|nr:ATP-binding cassette domain-containing protein [Celeribacter indicus]AJE45036.1 ABC transporter [Celeribacter indicus]SDX57807.1 thiamine transport system ATP-binding protein [Celeribacter indicus]
MLELKDVSLTQGDFILTADFGIPEQARVAVLGPSGAGKSTLLSVIGGFETPDRGKVVWNGTDFGSKPPFARPISHLFQDNNLFGHMSAAQNVGLGIRPDLKLSPADRTRVSVALGAVGLTGLETRRPAELSGGQQSRVALARVLVQEKPLVLLDEPFSALGPAMRREMVDLARQVGDRLGATMLMVTHDIPDVEAFADQVIWVEQGRCHPPRPWDALLADPPEGFRAYTGT